jgi:crotonobetainyl-CoA:carnitine CoA-transferase CaiB-like acyl-CoA transferase
MAGLSNIRVLDFSTEIAGPYATKLFSDAGADVIKVESGAGDPLRRWTATGSDLGDDDGALFRFLHHGKRSIVGTPSDPEVWALMASANLLVDSARPALFDHAAVRKRWPHVVVLSITPFGRTGPYAERAATEFTVQAESGGVAVRGHRSRPPIMAGGRLGEWVTGTVAGVAAAAAVWSARRSGKGDYIDLAMLEVHNVASGLAFDLTHSLGGRPAVENLGPPRTIETPSIEPTLDGWVGFCTNSRQQFDDFLVLIERPDLLGDEQLARVHGRTARLNEWQAIVRAWTTRHTTDEVVKRATQLRIPVAPVLNGATVLEFEHFRERGVFVDDPTGRFLMPRRPWRLNDQDPPPPRPAPGLGEHNGQIERRAAHRALGWTAGAPGGTSSSRPLEGLRVLDFTAWWAGPAATNVLAGLGADVIHIESVQRPDGMRMAGGMFYDLPQWWERSAIYLLANTNKRGLTLDLTSDYGRRLVLRLIAVSDVMVENFTPRVMANFGLDWDTVHRANPSLIMVRMPAFGLTGPWRDNTGFAQTMEQTTGLAWVTGYPDDQPLIQRGPSDPNAGMHAAFALLVALAEREATGAGQHVEVTMIEAALNAAAEQVIEYTAYGNLLEREGNRSPHAAPQNLYACRGEEQWLAVSVQTDAQWERLARLFGRPAWASDQQLASHTGRRAAHDRLDEQLSRWAAGHDLDDAINVLSEHGVPAGRAYDTRLTYQHPQLSARHFFEEIDHPVVGVHPVPGLPFRMESVDRWLLRAAPTLGQHNREILGGLLGLGDDELADLEAAGVIGTWPSRL